MNLNKKLAVVAAAFALLAVSAGNAFASTESGGKTELQFCDGWTGHPGECIAAIVPSDEIAQASGAIDTCLESRPSRGDWNVADVEACTLSSGYQASPRSVIDANGVIHKAAPPALKLKRRHKARHSRHRAVGQASRV